MWHLLGDLHLTDRSQDAYRFGVFDWLRRRQEKNPVAATFLAGDITDSKDRHSATLVNKIVAGLMKLQPPVYIAMGNHDYRDNKSPFFKFLNHIDGLAFVTEPCVIKAGRRMAIIPHFRTQDEFDRAVHGVCNDKPDCFLVHQTFDGAIAESGVRLSGLSASPIESARPPLGVYAGDVHRPQTQGQVTYIGCPYQVRFGDDFDPRTILVSKNGDESEFHYPAPRKWSLVVRDEHNVLKHPDLLEGDQIKLTIEVPREEAVEWKAIRSRVLAACKELKLEVYGVKLEVKTSERTKRVHIEDSRSNDATFAQFCKSEHVSNRVMKAGEKLIKGE